MKPINEIIAGLVARGFVLPTHVYRDGLDWMYYDTNMLDSKAFDLIACEFARQGRSQNWLAEWGWQKWAPYMAAIVEGDTEAALRALWEAVCE